VITVRLANLADTAAIVALYKQNLQLPDSAPLTDSLSLYERWREGGAWAAVETCAVHLNRLLAGVGVPLVAEADGVIVGEAEVYESFEQAPFGHHLHIGTLVVGAGSNGAVNALIQYIIEMGRLMRCERVTYMPNKSDHDPNRERFEELGFKSISKINQVRFAAQEGRAFYQSSELTDRGPEQVKGWAMPLGRCSSSRQEWDQLFPQDWAAGLPDLLNVATSHLKITVTGQNAIIFMRDTDTPAEASVCCWAARPLSNPLITAIRDCAFRAGYRTIVSCIGTSDLVLLGNDVELVEAEKPCLALAL
jgi:hypothetical protein